MLSEQKFKLTQEYINHTDINGAIGILRKGNAISDANIVSLRDRGDIVSPKVLNINP